MKLLPSKEIHYKTHLKEDELMNRLEYYIEPEKTFRLGYFNGAIVKEYEGAYNKENFSILRILGYKMSSQPRIFGIINYGADSTIIKVKMKIDSAMAFMIYLWSTIAAVGLVIWLVLSIKKGEFNFVVFIFFGALLVMYNIAMTGFKYESERSINDLARIFDAEAKVQ